jgi:hypothetical protein
VALALVALYLAGRDPEHEPAWSWRPATGRDDEEVAPDAPFELTVGPATPFSSRDQDHDRPDGAGSGRQGISG